MTEFRHIVRIANTDLDGNRPIYHALRKIKGVSFSFANAVCSIAKVKKTEKTGNLSEKDVEQLETVIKNPSKFNIPVWMFNRRKDFETDEDLHLVASDLTFTQDNDIKILKKIKSYKGLRHQWKLPLRGQQTKSNFRKSKVVGAAKKKRR